MEEFRECEGVDGIDDALLELELGPPDAGGREDIFESGKLSKWEVGGDVDTAAAVAVWD